MNHTYNALFFVTLAAVLGPWISLRIFKSIIPSVVIEIALGYFIGSHGLNVASDTSGIQFIANFGFSYLMFLSGMELDFELAFQQKDQGTPSWVRGILFFGVTLLISFAASLGLSLAGYKLNLVMTTLLLSTTSVGLVMPALKESGWIREELGQELVLYALIADIATLLVFSAYITIHSTGNAFSLLLIMVLLVFFGFVYRVLHVARRFSVFQVLTNTSSEVGIRGAFTLILAFLAFAQTLGTEVIIGAFLAGAIISLLSENHSLITRKLNSIGYGFFVPIFFVHVGMQFNVASLGTSPAFYAVMAILFITLFLNKLLPVHWFLRRFPQRQRWAGGFLLSSRLSLMIAAGQIGRQAGLISSDMSNMFVLLAIATCVVSPAAFNHLLGSVQGSKERLKDEDTLSIGKNNLPDGWVVRQIEVCSHLVLDIPLRRFRLSPDLLIVSIFRGDERIPPRGHTKLEQFDILQVIGTPDQLDRLESLFRQK